MSDLIDRGKAIDIVNHIIVKEVTPAYMLVDKAEVLTELMMMPSEQPERFNPCTVCQEFDCTGCKFRRIGE